MTKSINKLIPDIYNLVRQKDEWFNDARANDFATSVARRLQTQLGAKPRAPSLRLSKMGQGCPRAFWYSLYHPELAEPLPPWAEIKYSFGHIVEALAITLAKSAGHTVEGEQEHVVLDGIAGHLDCIVDGCVVDVKSTSSRGFQKFKTGAIRYDDGFGYLEQLDGYVVACRDDPRVSQKHVGYILAVDKTLGHMVLYEHVVREEHIHERIRQVKQIAGLREPPTCECHTVADGKSGNRRLDMRASYSAYKHCCFPGLRTFLYSDGPVYLTHVGRKPDVQEVDRHGQIVYLS